MRSREVYEGISSLGPAYVGVVAGLAGYTLAFAGFLVCLLLRSVILVGLHYSSV